MKTVYLIILSSGVFFKRKYVLTTQVHCLAKGGIHPISPFTALFGAYFPTPRTKLTCTVLNGTSIPLSTYSS